MEDALTYYKRSKDFGVERAAVHIRNVRPYSLMPHGSSEVDPIVGERQDLRQKNERSRRQSGAGAIKFMNRGQTRPPPICATSLHAPHATLRCLLLGSGPIPRVTSNGEVVVQCRLL